MKTISQLVAGALMSGSPTLRVSQGLRPATQLLPAVVFTIVSVDEDTTLDGDGGLVVARVQVDAWADHPVTAEGTADEARTLMLAASTFSATVLDGGFQDFEDETRLYRRSSDYRVAFER